MIWVVFFVMTVLSWSGSSCAFDNGVHSSAFNIKKPQGLFFLREIARDYSQKQDISVSEYIWKCHKCKQNFTYFEYLCEHVFGLHVTDIFCIDCLLLRQEYRANGKNVFWYARLQLHIMKDHAVKEKKTC